MGNDQVVSLDRRVAILEDALASIPERTALDEIERQKDNSRIVELERMVTELRAANIQQAKLISKLDTDITINAADLADVKELISGRPPIFDGSLRHNKEQVKPNEYLHSNPAVDRRYPGGP